MATVFCLFCFVLFCFVLFCFVLLWCGVLCCVVLCCVVFCFVLVGLVVGWLVGWLVVVVSECAFKCVYVHCTNGCKSLRLIYMGQCLCTDPYRWRSTSDDLKEREKRRKRRKTPPPPPTPLKAPLLHLHHVLLHLLIFLLLAKLLDSGSSTPYLPHLLSSSFFPESVTSFSFDFSRATRWGSR